MVSPQKFYVQEISKKTNYRANWLPDKEINVGDVGKIEDGIFTLYTTLEQQGIPFKLRQLPSDLNPDYSSTDSVSITLNGHDTTIMIAGLPVPQGKAMCKIEFRQAEGVVFQIAEPVRCYIENLNEIENRILEKYKKSIWDLGWVIVTEIVRPRSATIVINNGTSNTLEFEISSEADLRSVNLADPTLHLRLVHETGASAKFIAMENLSLLYMIKGISDPLFGKTKFRGASAYRAIQFNALRELPFNPSEIT